MLESLREAIDRYGIGIGNDVVKVDSFLNHRIDVKLSTEMGRAFYEAFRNEQPDMIMTVESSGIAIAITTAQAFGCIPVVFAKKASHSNVGNDVYTAEVYSYTHQKLNVIRVSRNYLPAGSRVLLIDDFLANGEALEGMLSLLNQAGCTCVGAGICVEKGFQPGGQKLREQGVRVVSLATVEAIRDGKIVLKED